MANELKKMVAAIYASGFGRPHSATAGSFLIGYDEMLAALECRDQSGRIPMGELILPPAVSAPARLQADQRQR